MQRDSAMSTHLCSTCLGMPLEHARFLVKVLSSASPSITHCLRSSGAEGVILNSEIAAAIAEDLLDCYDSDQLGHDLHTCLSRDFHLFADDYDQRGYPEIAGLLFGSDSEGRYRLKDSKNFRQIIHDFHEELKTSRRFFFDIDKEFAFIFDTLDSLIKRAKPSSDYSDLNADVNELCRARLGANFDRERNPIPYPIDEMGAAPNHACKGGRINPPGMSFLYLASNENTAALEIRATPADVFTVVKVALQNEPLLLDLRRCSFSALFEFEYLSDERWIEEYLQKVAVYTYLSEILAQPVASEDPLGYIHTQIFCEYLKIKGIHGLIYDSTLCSSGFNVCIFEPTDYSELVGESRLARVSALSAEVVSPASNHTR